MLPVAPSKLEEGLWLEDVSVSVAAYEQVATQNGGLVDGQFSGGLLTDGSFTAENAGTQNSVYYPPGPSATTIVSFPGLARTELGSIVGSVPLDNLQTQIAAQSAVAEYSEMEQFGATFPLPPLAPVLAVSPALPVSAVLI